MSWQPPPTLTNPNILIVMVDQMRLPMWMTSSQMNVFKKKIMPNLMGQIGNNSFTFQQYYTAATICTAARGTFLTGLYAPQTGCYTNSIGATGVAALSPAFPTFATAIQALNPAYQNNVWWFGKWHVSTCTGSTPLAGYGFNTRTYPGGSGANPSPNGQANEGTNGGTFGNKYWANDSDIANDFVGWLQGQAPTSGAPPSPWCATVSLINPHDISEGPGWLEPGPIPPANVSPASVYFPQPSFPPPTAAPAVYSGWPSPWNNEDLKKVHNKPSLQYDFQKAINTSHGLVPNWGPFLNWYLWLHNYVDVQIGVVLNALAASPYASNTVVIFVADHGEHGGSHSLHDKGGAAYDEILRVPLFVSFPGQVGTTAMNQMCSSVDFFGLICDLATSGGGLWQQTYPDLANRQSFWNFLYQNTSETRISPNLGVPYIFHTSDDDVATRGNAHHHIVCFRTKTDPNAAQPGAKLNLYSAWNKCQTYPNSTAPEYEFYDYNPATTNNSYEMGNDYYSTNPTTQATFAQYMSEIGTWSPSSSGLIPAELNTPLVGVGTDGNPLTMAQTTGRQNYFDYIYGVGKCVA